MELKKIDFEIVDRFCKEKGIMEGQGHKNLLYLFLDFLKKEGFDKIDTDKMIKIRLVKAEGPINSDHLKKIRIAYNIKEANDILREYQKEVREVGYDKVDYAVELNGVVFTGTYDLTKKETPKFQEVIKRKLGSKYEDIEDFVNNLKWIQNK